MPYKYRLTVRKKRVNYPITVTSKETSDEGGWEDGLDNQALQLGFTRISLDSKLIGYAIISSKSDGPDSKFRCTVLLLVSHEVSKFVCVCDEGLH